MGRWLLVLALVAGVGLVRSSSFGAVIVMLVAFLAGGVIFNVLKEVPNEQQSRFWAFTAGIAACAALLLAL